MTDPTGQASSGQPRTQSAAHGPDDGDFETIRGRLDSAAFNSLRNTPYYADTVYPRYSPGEYDRRLRLTRAKMARLGLDCLIAGTAPLLQSYGGPVQWLTGHRDWHSLVVYVVVPLEGEPTLIYPMGGTHTEATRRAVAVRDVRSSRLGRFMEVAAERIRELGLANGRIGLPYVDSQTTNYLPVNQYRALREGLPDATLLRVGDFFHELLYLKSPEEQAYVWRAGELCARAIEAMVEAARPGVAEYELKAAAAFAIMDGGGAVDFIILGSCPMDDPALVFGNIRPSRRRLHEGDIIINELAVDFEGYQAQIGVPICVGEPTERVRRMFDEVTLPAFARMAAELRPGRTLREVWEAGRFIRAAGYQSRPLHLHAIDLATHTPHIGTPMPGGPGAHAEDYELVLKPGMELMLEPNPITLDGQLGLFLGHTFLVTESGHARVTDRLPLELMVARG
ncbi:MAG TPA: M24 family metallopeptidase [Ktedonobacterales bacterium]|nr:M24 family metallopeptidase [Ktedonobacterales bacterium]